METPTTWQEAAKEATWAILRQARNEQIPRLEQVYADMVGIQGQVENKHHIDTRNKRFSINTEKPRPGTPAPKRLQHQWVWPEKDDVDFYAEGGTFLGKTRSGEFFPPGHSATTRDQLAKETNNVFHPHCVRTKNGWKAQVVFGHCDYEEIENLPIVWEGDTVYTDDTEGDNKQTGNNKAFEAAQKAVSEAVEALFAKVKG